MATKDELTSLASEAKSKLDEALKAFEGIRAKGTVADLVQAGSAVTSAERANSKAAYDLATFALVGIYEGIKAQVLEAAKRWDVPTLLAHEISAVNIQVPLNAETGIEPERVSVNTLGKRTIVTGSKGGGTGARSRNVYAANGDKLNSRDLVERFGAEVLGEELTGKVLAEPGRFGLTHCADRVAKAKGFGKEALEPTPA